MASTPGRYFRFAMGTGVITFAITQAGWFLLLLPLGGFMIYSGLANVCPLGPVFRQPYKSGELLKNIQRYEI